MALAELTRLVPPPIRSSGVGTLERWRGIEQELGLVFPTDYREFVFAYGTGMFATEYVVYNPFGGTEYLAHVRYLCQLGREIRVQFPTFEPYPVWPEPGGLFPWGGDQNGNYYLWQTGGPPDRWQVVTNEVRGHGYREHHCTMTEYLVGVMDGRIRPLIGHFPTPDSFIFVAGQVTE